MNPLDTLVIYYTLVIHSKSKANIKLLFELAKKMSKKSIIESETAKSIDRGLKDLVNILNGKIKPKTLEDLLGEKICIFKTKIN